jgi:hypothetical protein
MVNVSSWKHRPGVEMELIERSLYRQIREPLAQMP